MPGPRVNGLNLTCILQIIIIQVKSGLNAEAMSFSVSQYFHSGFQCSGSLSHRDGEAVVKRVKFKWSARGTFFFFFYMRVCAVTGLKYWFTLTEL